MVIDGPAAPNPVNSSKGAERKQKIVSKKNVLMQSQSYTKQAKLIYGGVMILNVNLHYHTATS